MKKFTVEIEVANSAFELDEEYLEIVRILREEVIYRLADYELDGIESFPLRDINGNTVGKAQFHYGRK